MTTVLTSWGHGPWGGGGPNPWGGGLAKLHYYALKKVFPIQSLAGDLDNDLTIEGKYLDQVFYQDQNELTPNLFPDTATSDALLPDFERLFNLPGTGTDAQRQAAVTAAEQQLINKNGKMNPAFYIALGVTLGYTDVSIHEGVNDMFILAYAPNQSVLPHALYDLSHTWVWTITSSMIPVGVARDQWEFLITNAAPAFSKVIFVY
jgi:uncharacterized protein YmfQ (DUF2313 family)